MTDKEYIRNLRKPSIKKPLKILMSSCLYGIKCGVDGTDYSSYPDFFKAQKKIKSFESKKVKMISFCPEEYSFGTPREMCDIYGGNGMDVLEGKAKVLTESGFDWTTKLIESSIKMLEIAKNEKIDLAIMTDVSAACGSQVIYDGNRKVENPVVQIGMGVCAAQLIKNGFKVICQRDFEALEILFSKIDENYVVDKDAKDFDKQEWYVDYFQK